VRPADPGLVRDLGRLVSPERVLSRAIERLARSRDASIYRLVPEAVVRPRDLGEMRALFAYARRRGRHLTFRAAGTSLSGQAVGDDLLVEIGPHWRAFRVLDGGARVWSQPGVIGGHLNRFLAPGHRIGPDPASIDAAMIGGILANNSSGMCCGVAQNAYHTLETATLLLADGTIVDTARPDADARLRHDAPLIHAGLSRLRDDVRSDAALVARIRQKFARKNTTAYSLNAFLDYDSPAALLAHLMVGSQGTLGFVADLTLRTIPEPPARATALLVFAELRAAGATVLPLAAAGADAVEILDAACLRVLARTPTGAVDVRGGAAALLVEFRRAEEGSLAAAEAAALAILADAGLRAPARFTRDAGERAALWKMRKGLAPSTGALRPSGTAYLTEDVAFPVERLAEAIGDCQSLFAAHAVPETIVFGHARDGNLHFVLSADLQRAEAVAGYDRFLRALVDLVVGRYDGALKAEHGSGRNMAPFVRTEWGDAAYAVMRRLKGLLDPAGILNPGVVLNDDPEGHLRNLKAVPEISLTADHCTECGLCEPRCPSRDLTLTPRQRIVIERELAALARSALPESRGTREILEAELGYQGLSTCAGDGMCGVACPVGIDTGRLMKERRVAAHTLPERAAAQMAADHFGAGTLVARAALRVVPLLASFGLGPGDDTPRAAPPLPRPPAGSPHRVVYYPSCLTRTLGPAPGDVPVAEAMHQVLSAGGFGVVHPAGIGGLCCGLPFTSKGFPEAAASALRGTVEALWSASREGHDSVVTDASPCARTLASATDLLSKGSRRLEVLDFPTFWAKRALPGLNAPRRVSGVAVLHPTCSLVASGGLEELRRVAHAHAETAVVPIAAECCGFAGDRGFLVPELTASATRAEAEEVASLAAAGHYSTCRTCEIGMSRATGRGYRSIIHLVHESLGLG
jgi:D-lactate dehydrogenase